jgi:hypothetical protein
MLTAAFLAVAAPAPAPASATVRVLRPVVVRSADARRHRWRERIVRRPDGTIELQRLLELE